MIDTGPPYPKPDASTPNEIGLSSFDWWRTILSQYANSPRIIGVIEKFSDAVDPNKNLLDFYWLVWNVDTAVGYGLDVWGRIVGVERILEIVEDTFFGFREADDPNIEGFDQSPFYTGKVSTSNYRLSDDVYRRLILAKAAYNITDCSIHAINSLLAALFEESGNAYVTDGSEPSEYFGFSEQGGSQPFGCAPLYDGSPLTKMEIQYVFCFELSTIDFAIVSSSGVLPKPTGVKSAVVINV